MQQNLNSSFWADIKKFEDTLAKDPSSYCFAPLAELYRKTGLLEDALSIAEKGTSRHPQYVGGYMALGRAYLDKGMIPEGREALERVVKFTPENMLAQKLLCQIYMDSGENELLRHTLESLLSLNAADAESRLLLESLERISTLQNVTESETKTASFDSNEADYKIDLMVDNESLLDLEEIDLVDELEEITSNDAQSAEVDSNITEQEPADLDLDKGFESDSSLSIRTATIADLYAAQGHHEQALNIYKELQQNSSGNAGYDSKIDEIKGIVSTPVVSSDNHEDPWSDMLLPTERHDMESHTLACSMDSGSFQKCDQLTAILQDWLVSIRRLKECHSGKD